MSDERLEQAANMVAHLAFGKDTVSEIEKAYQGFCMSDAKAIVNAYFNGDKAYVVCPDCDGMGSVWIFPADRTLDEVEQTCERCVTFVGMVHLNPKDTP